MTQLTPDLENGPLRLRAPGAGDVRARFALGNTPEINHMFGADPETVPPITMAQAQAWVAEHEATPMAWIIDYQDRLIGSARLHSLNNWDKRAILAIGILDPDLLGQGIGTQAMQLILAYGFDTLGLHRICLRVIDYNARAIAAYKKLGFVVEGRERESARVGDTWHDDLIMGLVAHDHRRAA